MRVSFTKRDVRRHSVQVERDRAPDLWCGSIGYDDELPHDLLHLVAEAEFGLDGGIFGDLSSGGNARIFMPVDKELIAKMWREPRIRRTRLRDGRRSEKFAWQLYRDWRRGTLPSDR